MEKTTDVNLCHRSGGGSGSLDVDYVNGWLDARGRRNRWIPEKNLFPEMKPVNNKSLQASDEERKSINCFKRSITWQLLIPIRIFRATAIKTGMAVAAKQTVWYRMEPHYVTTVIDIQVCSKNPFCDGVRRNYSTHTIIHVYNYFMQKNLPSVHAPLRKSYWHYSGPARTA